MKKTIIILALISLGLSSLAQEGVKVASDVSPPDQSAMLEVESSSKGVLIPRVDIVDLNTAAPVSNPATSLMVYNTNTTSGVGFYYWHSPSPCACCTCRSGAHGSGRFCRASKCSQASADSKGPRS